MIYIIDTYQKYSPQKPLKICRVNDIEFGIYELPSIEERFSPIDEEQQPSFYIYNTFEEAENFLKLQKKNN